MSRSKLRKKFIIKKDSLYNSIIVTMFINKIMKNGKKNLAKKIVYNVLKRFEQNYLINPIKFLEKAIYNIMPNIDLENNRKKNRKPILINKHKQISLSYCMNSVIFSFVRASI